MSQKAPPRFSKPTNKVDQMPGASILETIQEHKVLIATTSTWTISSLSSYILLRKTGADFTAQAPRAAFSAMLNASLFLTICVAMLVSGHGNVLKCCLMPLMRIGAILSALMLGLFLILVLLAVIPLGYILCYLFFVAAAVIAEKPALRQQARETLEALRSFASQKVLPQVVANPVATTCACTWLGSSLLACFLLYKTGASLSCTMVRIVLRMMLFGCCLLTAGVGWVMQAMKKPAVEEKLITEAPQKTQPPTTEQSKVWKSLRTMPSLSALPAMPKPADISWKPAEMSSDTRRTVRNTTISAAGGAVAFGAGGGMFGLSVGSVVGAAVGVVPALFTFGLSIPVSAAIGGSIGCVTGSAVGGTAGAIGGGTAGLAYTRLTLKEKQ